MRLLRWLSLTLTAVGVLLGLLAMTSSPWLQFSANGQDYGVGFSLVQKLVRTASSSLPVATNVFFAWAAWVFVVVLAIGATLSAVRLPRSELIAGVTVAVALAAIAMLIAATRPLVRPQSGVGASAGPWFAGGGYLTFGVAAVLGAVASVRSPRRSVF